jgi:poly(A) polymerase
MAWTIAEQHFYFIMTGKKQITANLEQRLKSWFAGVTGWEPPSFLVGGAVRDILLGRSPKDLDLAHMQAGELAELLRNHHRATLVPLFEKDTVKSTWRLVRKSADGTDELDLSSFHGNSLGADLSNRDFTINAMALAIGENGRVGNLADPFNGREDLLEHCLVRQTGSQTFPADPLRILRAYRFAAVFDLRISSETRAAIRQYRSLLSQSAKERQLVELKKIFSSERAFAVVSEMDEDGVLELLFPEIEAMKGCTQNSYHHRDVWGHSLLVLRYCEVILGSPASFFREWTDEIRKYLAEKDRIPLLKLAALLHDMGKPGTRGLRDDGRITFYGHDHRGAEMMGAIAERFRMGKHDSIFLQRLVAGHLQVLNLSRPGVNTGTLRRWFRNYGDDCLGLLIIGMADIKGTLGTDSSEQARNVFVQWAEKTVGEYLRFKKVLARPNLISGKDLLDLGMQPGPELGSLLKEIQHCQDAGEVTTPEEALDFVKAKIKNTSGNRVNGR